MRWLMIGVVVLFAALALVALVVTGLTEDVPPQDDPERMDEYE